MYLINSSQTLWTTSVSTEHIYGVIKGFDDVSHFIVNLVAIERPAEVGGSEPPSLQGTIPQADALPSELSCLDSFLSKLFWSPLRIFLEPSSFPNGSVVLLCGYIEICGHWEIRNILKLQWILQEFSWLASHPATSFIYAYPLCWLSISCKACASIYRQFFFRSRVYCSLVIPSK